ncbi:MAG: methylmalonyl-CoA epimerase [Deltaproteobacteria bacterium]|nr:methylmalonyl-CoA epimerase [Deltaproteobacteria bacterium]
MMERIDHIGIAVKDLEATLKFYEETLGFKVGEKMDHGTSRGAFVTIGEVDFELLENKDRSSAIARHIEKRGEGFQHIAFQVKNIAEAIEELKKKGIRFIDEKPRPGARGSRIAFIHPQNTYGVLMELVER